MFRKNLMKLGPTKVQDIKRKMRTIKNSIDLCTKYGLPELLPEDSPKTTKENENLFKTFDFPNSKGKVGMVIMNIGDMESFFKN